MVMVLLPLIIFKPSYKFIIHFIDSESTEKMMKLLIDIFDVLNGRSICESITESYWNSHRGKDGKQKPGKKAIIEKMLSVIELTENCKNDPLNRPQWPTFASQTTLESWRLTIFSTSGITQELLYSKTQWRSTTFSSLPDGTRIL
jgi:hypothetical protein